MKDIAKRLVKGETIKGDDALEILKATSTTMGRLDLGICVAMAYIEAGYWSSATLTLEQLRESINEEETGHGKDAE